MGKILDKAFDFWNKIIPNKSKRYSIRIMIFGLLVYLSILGSIVVISHWIAISLFVVSLIMVVMPFISVSTKNITLWDAQDPKYRRLPSNKYCIYVEFEPGCWSEYKLSSLDGVNRFSNIIKNANINYEIGGPDGLTDMQKMCIKRSEIIEDLLS